ncbi:MAG: carbohydrate ABC transporter permease [Caldilineaceae bacterium]|nr:carbohydrate ABC transporter permease [Caldilineaceae bacterium]
MQADQAVPKPLVTTATTWHTGHIRRNLTGIVLHILLSVGAVAMVLPFVWMVSTSFKELAQVFVYPPEWIPDPFVWENYPKAMTAVPFGRWFLNSLVIAVLVTVGQLLTCSLAGFTFARMRFPGRNVLFLIYLGTMMIPHHVTIIPIFVMMNALGLVNTFWPLIIPGLASAWGTFLFRQFFLTLPQELEDAAKIDGSSFFRIYTQIFMPLAKPVLATLGVFTFMGSWNDFLGPLIFLQSKDLKTLTIGLLQFRADFQGMGNWPVMMAGVVISVLPVLIAFVIGQKYFVRGIALTGIKG